MSKKKMFILGCIGCLFLFCSIFTYAYFMNVIDGNTHNVSVSLNDSTIVDVDTFEEFLDATRLYDTSKNDDYNSDKVLTEKAKRKTVRLLVDIKLKSDVLIDADCHFNLNGKQIDLSGYKLIFKHQFDGVFTVYGGKIVDSSTVKGSVVIDCPNACIDFDKETVVSDADINVVNASANQVMNSAMKLVYSNIQNGGINDFYTTIDEVEDFGLDICKNNTEFDHGNGTSCVYTYTDLDLIHSYFAYEGLEITYESSNPDVLSNGGRVLSNSESTTVELTITIKYQEQTLTPKKVNVHIVAPDDFIYASNSVLLMYLQKYYDGNKYVFNKTFLLPKVNTYFNTNYTYIMSTESTTTYRSDAVPSNIFDNSLYTDYVSVGLSKEIKQFQIESTDGTNTAITDNFNVEGEASSIIDDNQSYAVGIIQILYGNQLIVRDGQITLSGYSEFQLLCNPQLNGYSRLDSITNVLDDSEEIFEIYDYPSGDSLSGNYQLLHVKPNAETLPYISQTVFLEVHFDFTEDYEDEQITIIVPVIYEPSVVGEGFNQFDPYYVHFNKEFNSVTKNYTYENFSIPLTFEGNYPTYAFIVYVEDEEGTNGFSKVNDNLIQTIPSTDSYTNISSSDLMNITINPYYINREDTTYYFAYIPVYKNSSGNGVLYYTMENGTTDNLDEININPLTYQYISVLTIPGIVRYNQGTFQNEAFADMQFYEIAYEAINGIDTFKPNETFILTNTLENYIDVLDFSNPTNNTSSLLHQSKYGYTINFASTPTNNDTVISSLKGIELLKGINKLTFNSTTLTTNNNTNFVTNLSYISQITNLQILDLSNTNIFDQTQGFLSFPSGDDNGFLQTLSALNNLKELNLSNNAIYDFTALENFASLQKVDVGGNKFSDDTWLIGGIITSIINGLYGSDGAINIGVFATLLSNGVKVEGAGSTTDIPEGTQAIIDALSSLEYQDRLSKDIDLADVVDQYVSGTTTIVYNTYGLLQQYKITNEGKDIVFDFTSVTFDVAEDGTSFTMFIDYHWSVVAGLSGTNQGDVQYKYTYKVTRY